MFPEFRELITHLKTTNPHFVRLFDKHNELDVEITKLEAGLGTDHAIEVLKKEKLLLKDRLYTLLKAEPALRN